jgi:hypothetical protein
MKYVKVFLGLLLLGGLVSATSNNFQPIGVQYNESFNACNITVRNDSNVLIANQVFTFPATTNVVVYMTNLTSWYGERYNFSVKINHTVNGWMEVYNDTWGFLGRGTIEASNVLTATPSAAATNYLSSAAQIYSFVTGQGYLVSEADPVALAKFGTLTAGKYCKTDGTQIICTYTVPDAYDDSALWSNASGQQLHITNLWANASSQEARISAITPGAVQPNIDGANITSGTVADARIASTITRDSEVPSLETDSAHDTCAEISGCVVGALSSTAAQDNNITNLWTNASIQEGKIAALLLNDTNENVRLAGFDTSVSNLWSNASSQEVRMSGLSGSIVDQWTNASDQQLHITNLWVNATGQQTSLNNLWTNASNQQAQLWQKNSTCYWIRFP